MRYITLIALTQKQWRWWTSWDLLSSRIQGKMRSMEAWRVANNSSTYLSERKGEQITIEPDECEKGHSKKRNIVGNMNLYIWFFGHFLCKAESGTVILQETQCSFIKTSKEGNKGQGRAATNRVGLLSLYRLLLARIKDQRTDTWNLSSSSIPIK